MKDMTQSWNRKPFVALEAFDAEETTTCPAEYPEDLLYDIWLGTRTTCDCLEREEERAIFFDRRCDKSIGDSETAAGDEISADCHDVPGLAPMVLNTFNGVRYCGK